jgi:hypothetical protein
MLASGAALVPASGIMLEALASNLYVIGGFYAQNQCDIYSYLIEHRMIYGIGDLGSVNWNTLEWPLISSFAEKIRKNNPISGKRVLSNLINAFYELR